VLALSIAGPEGLPGIIRQQPIGITINQTSTAANGAEQAHYRNDDEA